MDDDATNVPDHESDDGDGETDGARNSRSKKRQGGNEPLGDPRPWVHPSEFRRFVDLYAPARPSPLTPAEQTRRSAIAMAAMGFLVAGLLLLTGGSHPTSLNTVELTFTPHPSLLIHFASERSSVGSAGARVTSYFANEARDSKFKIGDVIVSCDRTRIADAAQLTQCLNRHCVDEQVEFEILRNTEIRHVKVKLDSGP